MSAFYGQKQTIVVIIFAVIFSLEMHDKGQLIEAQENTLKATRH